MTHQSASVTAMGVAVLRTAHQVIDGEPKILEDPISEKLLDRDQLNAIYENPERFQTPVARGLRSHIVTRSRYAEDRLAEAVARGISQFVLLGAGLDTFAYRQPSWAKALTIFEVDHAMSQQAKIEKLRSAGIPIPTNTVYVESDFEKPSLVMDLVNRGFDPDKPAFFSSLGVLVYLSETAVNMLFRSIAALTSGTEFVFSFSPPDDMLKDDSRQRRAALSSIVASVGEQWKTHFVPEQLSSKLYDVGYQDVLIFTPADTYDVYIKGRTDGLPGPRTAYLAKALV